MSGGVRLGFVGGGNMAQALIRGVAAAGLYRSSQIAVTDVSAVQRRRLRSRFGVKVGQNNLDLVRDAPVVVLAVKPQVLPQVLAEVAPAADATKLFVSIAAGIPMGRIEEGLGGGRRVVRVMPNTPALLGKGMSVLVRNRRASKKDAAAAMALFRGVGDAVEVSDERLIDAVTGVSGSGPAYVYRFAEALIEGGVRVGLKPALAARLAFQTLAGAAEMLQRTKQSPRELREMVSSPGGTTLAGLAALDGAGFVETVCAAIVAATERSKELGHRAMEAH